jgi:hypothetical protein
MQRAKMPWIFAVADEFLDETAPGINGKLDKTAP